MEAVAEGKDVIIDGTNTQRFNRKLLTYFRRSPRLLTKCKGGDEFGLEIC